MNNLRTILTILLGLIALTGAVYGFFTYVTPIDTHNALAAKVEYMGTQDQIRWVQQQVWAMQKHYDCFSYDECMHLLPAGAKDQYKYLEEELVRLKEELSR